MREQPVSRTTVLPKFRPPPRLVQIQLTDPKGGEPVRFYGQVQSDADDPKKIYVLNGYFQIGALQ